MLPGGSNGPVEHATSEASKRPRGEASAARLLLSALASNEQSAWLHWQEWREARADLDAVTDSEVRLLPLVYARIGEGRFRPEDHPIVAGVSRRAWLEEQLLQEVVVRRQSALQVSDCETAALTLERVPKRAWGVAPTLGVERHLIVRTARGRLFVESHRLLAGPWDYVPVPAADGLPATVRARRSGDRRLLEGIVDRARPRSDGKPGWIANPIDAAALSLRARIVRSAPQDCDWLVALCSFRRETHWSDGDFISQLASTGASALFQRACRSLPANLPQPLAELALAVQALTAGNEGRRFVADLAAGGLRTVRGRLAAMTGNLSRYPSGPDHWRLLCQLGRASLHTLRGGRIEAR